MEDCYLQLFGGPCDGAEIIVPGGQIPDVILVTSARPRRFLLWTRERSKTFLHCYEVKEGRYCYRYIPKKRKMSSGD